jgi:sugar lactone lactonase YvrE
MLFAFVIALSLTQMAAAQTLLLPSAEAYDAAGNLFFVDTNRNQVFEVALSGALTVVAGNGMQGFAGDSALAINAELNAPQGIAIGTDGTVYISDTGNQRIRSVVDGIVTTVAGNGQRGFSGDNAAATAVKLNTPTALAIDGQGLLLLCDTANHRIRRITQGIITTIAGNGIQGFSGDGGIAIAAKLDSPTGIAVAADGRVFIADTHNQRIRAIATDGTITTIAGTGVAGFSGDGASALAAKLSLPRSLAIDASGNILIADSNNQRIRSINTQGIITTIVGSGVQGVSPDDNVAVTASLNTPRAVAASVSTIGFTDTSNKLVREIAANGEIYTVAPLSVSHVSSVTLHAPASMVYGQGSVAILVASNATQPQGSVRLLDGASQIATATLAGGAATISLGTLAAGSHQLSATYTGDGLNPAATSNSIMVSVLPAPVTASANAVTITYGQLIPVLFGSDSGILPQDASSVSMNFATTAGLLSPVGSYPIVASLSGASSSNYVVTTGPGAGSLTIVQAGSSVTLPSVASQSYVGLPLLLTAHVASATSGLPTGEVDFSDGSTVVSKAIVVNGVASGIYSAPIAGTHTIAATYMGDTNFLGSSSAVVTTAVAAMPDFGMTITATSQTVQGGLIASYPLAVSPVGGTFTGSVSFSVSGLPAGAVASFSPAIVVPGATGAAVTMSIQTIALAENASPQTIVWTFCTPIGFLFFLRRKHAGFITVTALSCFLFAVIGCGARTVSTETPASQAYKLTVTATSTNLAGAAISHSTPVSLIIQ